MDSRFKRLYILKIKMGEIKRLRQLCEGYHIANNNVFDGAKDFHLIYEIN